MFMSINGYIGEIREKPTLFRILLFIVLMPLLAVGVVATFWVMSFITFAAVAAVHMMGPALLAAITEPPPMADIATVDMRLGGPTTGIVAELVYISHDGSYIGITPDRSDEDKKDSYEFTLVPRSELEQHTDRVASTYREGKSKYFKQEFDPRDGMYAVYGKPPSREAAAILGREYSDGDGCPTTPMRVTRNYLQISSSCNGTDKRALKLGIENLSIPDSDLPLHFNESSHYTSPFSDCVTFPASTGDEKTICYRKMRDRRQCGFDNYCNVHKIRFTNTKTQQQVTKKIPDYITEGGFLGDGTFYLAFNGGPGHAQGVYIVPDDYFINNL